MKRNLLDECNDQRVPPRDFMGTFCKRCRNRECSNAGWASSTFEERVRTQVDRLLVNPYQARSEDTRFDPLRAMHFVEIPAEVALARLADPWAGPTAQARMVLPPASVTTNQGVEAAVSKLADAQGCKASELGKGPGGPLTAVNTDFPDEGVMIGGGPVAPPPSVDPWTPKAKITVVPRGAKIKMGG